ncbi:MAG: PAS domain-containing protein [Synergistales bacterium]|nr:PAS domain-containing protein [Synergistales bacterium]
MSGSSGSNGIDLHQYCSLARIGCWEYRHRDGTLRWGVDTAAIFGIPPEELGDTLQGFLEAVHPRDREQVAAMWRRSRETAEPCETEHRIGDTLWMRSRCSTVFDAQGRPERTLGIMQDITRHRRTEDTLRTFMDKHESILNTIPAMVFWLDREGRFIRVNRPFAERHRCAPEDINGRSLYDLYPPEEVRRYQRDNREVMASGVPKRGIEEPFHTPTGFLWVHTDKIPLTDETGAVIGIVGFAVDITARKEAEQRLRESRKLFADTVQSLDGIVVLLDGSLTIQVASKAVGTLLGIPAPVEGRSCYRAILGRDEPCPDCPARLAMEKRETVQARRRMPDGRVFQRTVSPVIGEDGQVRGVTILATDITEHTRTTERLRADEEAARAANKAKSEFLAAMSHEIRTPLNGVIGMAGLLLDSPLSGEQRRYAEIVRASGESLLHIINDILDLSKIEAGRFALDAADFNLRETMDEMAATLALEAHEKGLELLCSPRADCPTMLRGDPGLLRQVLTNLVGNAVKCTDEGQVTVGAEARRESEGQVELLFTVADTGCGIPSEEQERLFEAFNQVGRPAGTTRSGSGLGLAISRQLVELMGGWIGVESTPGEGSFFWFVLRLDKQPGAAEETPPPELAGLRILVASDNATQRRLFSDRAERWAMEPVAAAVPDALEILAEAEAPFRLAVVDTTNPAASEGLVRAIRADRRLSDLRIVLLVPLGAEARGWRGAGTVTRRLRDEGLIDATLSKPVRLEEHRRALGTALSGDAAPAEEPEKPPAPGLPEGRILLAEDNSTNQAVLQSMLDKLGRQTDIAANGEEALKALRRKPYDLVLMDVQMPIMDGLQATRSIRRGSAGIQCNPPEIPIIAMTAYALQGDRRRCLDAGMDDYLAKPVTPRSLAQVLEKWLPGEHPGAGAPPRGEENGGARNETAPPDDQPPHLGPPRLSPAS